MEDMKVRNIVFFLWRGVVSTSPNTLAGEPHLSGGPCVLIQYIYGHPPFITVIHHTFILLYQLVIQVTV
jgi:hypothetical protein